jgi:hypothetical protein
MFVFRFPRWLWPLLLLAAGAAAADPLEILRSMADMRHLDLVEAEQAEVVDHLVGLGAIQKTGGAWRLEHSERLSGTLYSRTWQVVDGYTSREVADTLLQAMDVGEPLYRCEARSCGPGAQWANRIFNQRILYGRADMQRYQVFAIDADDAAYRLVVYDSARTTDRQYLHVELLRLAEDQPQDALGSVLEN